ncbi:uncharacterized protein [Musca autumnalis]|uniref:uncharacterized protein n=1 Tax=Musca autumnalis TaxID=221902 RepID=UPI003CF3A802
MGNSETIYRRLFDQLMQDKRYESVLWYGDEGNLQHECFNVLDVLQPMEVPVIVMNSNVNFRLFETFNNEMVSWICMTSLQNMALFSNLASALDNIRYTRVIVQVMEKALEDELNDFFQFSVKLQMLNVMVCYGDFHQNQHYYLYAPFSPTKLEEHIFQSMHDIVIFPPRLQNLYGHPIRTLVEHTRPRAMEYYNAKGERCIVGPLGRFITTLIDKWNGTLTFPYDVPLNVTINYREFLPLMRNYSLDVPVTSSAIFHTDDIHEFSYPLELSYWCLLLPVEHPLEFRYLLLLLIKSLCRTGKMVTYKWPKYLINADAIQGVFGLSVHYKIPNRFSLRLIYLMLFVSGLTFTSIFNSNLFSIITHPLPASPIRSYEDVQKSSLKIAISQLEFDYFRNILEFPSSLTHSKFLILQNITDFYKLQDSFNRSYAYFTSGSKMFHYASFQEVKGVKMFRLSKEMCPNPMMLLQVPLSPNSYFRQAIHIGILEAWQSGLLYYWQKNSNSDVKNAGQKITVNLTRFESYSPINTKDMNGSFFYLFP